MFLRFFTVFVFPHHLFVHLEIDFDFDWMFELQEPKLKLHLGTHVGRTAGCKVDELQFLTLKSSEI